MTRYLDRLNLRPNERRLVVFVGVVVFIVLNVWFVWPHFGDLARAKARLARARLNLEKYQLAAAQLPEYESRVRELEKDNPAAAREDQSVELLRVVQSTAGKSGVNIMNVGKVTTKTNDFFIEQSLGITVQAKEEQLVNFLYELGMNEAMIRVRALSLRPDAPRMQLGGNVTLVASYQRKPTAAPTSPGQAAPRAAASAKPDASVKPGSTSTKKL